MRVLHVIPSMNPADGGPPVIAANIAVAQAALGHDVNLLSYASDGSYGDDAVLAPLAGHERVRRTLLPRPRTLRDRLLASNARPTLDRLFDAGVDMVHLHNIWEPILPLVARVARRRGVPYVVLPNGMLDPWSLAQRRWKKRVALALGYRSMLAHAAALHLGNADEQRLIAPLRLPTPGRVIPNGVSLSEFATLPAPGGFRAAHPELGDRPYVLFLSRLHYKKGLDYLADAFARVAKDHADKRLVVAGPDGGALATFTAQIAAAGLSARVHVVGPLYGRAKLEACVDAACFCLPSRQEGFSMAILEAMACAAPVVISENCHFPEVAAEEAGIVVPLDAAAVASGIGRLLADPAHARHLGDRARALILARYTWPKIAEQTLAMYDAARQPA